jgi:hypothetical protein
MTENNKPKLIRPAIDEAPITIEKPAVGGLERFKSKRSPNIASVETLLTALPHHKIGDAGDFVRLHLDEETTGPRNIASSTSGSSARKRTCCI